MDPILSELRNLDLSSRGIRIRQEELYRDLLGSNGSLTMVSDIDMKQLLSFLRESITGVVFYSRNSSIILVQRHLQDILLCFDIFIQLFRNHQFLFQSFLTSAISFMEECMFFDVLDEYAVIREWSNVELMSCIGCFFHYFWTLDLFIEAEMMKKEICENFDAFANTHGILVLQKQNILELSCTPFMLSSFITHFSRVALDFFFHNSEGFDIFHMIAFRFGEILCSCERHDKFNEVPHCTIEIMKASEQFFNSSRHFLKNSSNFAILFDAVEAIWSKRNESESMASASIGLLGGLLLSIKRMGIESYQDLFDKLVSIFSKIEKDVCDLISQNSIQQRNIFDSYNHLIFASSIVVFNCGSPLTSSLHGLVLMIFLLFGYSFNPPDSLMEFDNYVITYRFKEIPALCGIITQNVQSLVNHEMDEVLLDYCHAFIQSVFNYLHGSPEILYASQESLLLFSDVPDSLNSNVNQCDHQGLLVYLKSIFLVLSLILQHLFLPNATLSREWNDKKALLAIDILTYLECMKIPFKPHESVVDYFEQALRGDYRKGIYLFRYLERYGGQLNKCLDSFGGSLLSNCRLYLVLQWIKKSSSVIMHNEDMLNSVMYLFLRGSRSYFRPLNSISHELFRQLYIIGSACRHNVEGKLPFQFDSVFAYFNLCLQNFPKLISIKQLARIVGLLASTIKKNDEGFALLMSCMNDIVRRSYELVCSQNDIETGSTSDLSNLLKSQNGWSLAYLSFQLLKIYPPEVVPLAAQEIELLLSRLDTEANSMKKDVLHRVLYEVISVNCEDHRRTWLCEWFLRL